MEPTDEWWKRQLLKRVMKKRREEAAITRSLISEYEERHRNDGQLDELPDDGLGSDPVEPAPGSGSGYDGYIG